MIFRLSIVQSDGTVMGYTDFDLSEVTLFELTATIKSIICKMGVGDITLKVERIK